MVSLRSALSVLGIFYDSSFLKNQFLQILKLGKVPKHVGFIMDGNRRFAKQRSLPTVEGHKAGAQALVDALELCFTLGISEASVYAFSIENFNRPQKEVDDIHKMLRDTLKQISEKKLIPNHEVRLRITGNRSYIAPDILEELEQIEKTTNTPNVKNVVNVCFAYTARDEIAHSIQEVASQRVAKTVTKDEISENLLSENLYIGSSSKPLEILIRTSGETRLSDFLLWQCTSACNIVYIETLWPMLNFFDLYWILLKWGFQHSAVHEVQSFWMSPKTQKYTSLRSLPACPPFGSVTDITKGTKARA